MLRKSLLPALLLTGARLAIAQDSTIPELPPLVGDEAGIVDSVNPPAIPPAGQPAIPQWLCETTPALPPASPFAGPFLERPKLTGNWLGTRDQLAQQGIAIDVYSTQFYQGVTSGGINEEFDYAGRFDYLVNVDGEKAGLMKGSFFTLHGETRYGNTINFDTGAIMPANVGMLFPRPTGTVTALTGVKYTQFLSENLAVFGGKMNLLDELKQPYATGRGFDAFLNTGLALPIVVARTAPYSTLGAGFAVLENFEPVFTFMMMDTNNTPTTSGFESFFTNGVTFLSMINRPVEIFGLPGHQGIGGTYSTGTYSDLNPTPYYNPGVGFGIATGTIQGSWSMFYMADQALYVDPNNSKRSWGLFGNLGLADNGPSPVQWSGYVGLGGSSPMVSRQLDTFGVGYFYVGYSDPVQTLAPKLLPVGNDQGVEMFYNVAVTPWFRLTPDLQILGPARERTLPPNVRDIDTAVVFGLRAKIDF
ncbi:MAG: carbohydrate porin [Planctomycetota bacterium]|nr:carbohydrate porin [Planctomycetota bacterium]